MEFKKQLIDEINSARTNPSKYAEKVLKYKDYFDGKILKIPGNNAGIQTEEGPEAYDIAANYLKNLSSTEPLIPSKGLFKIANDYSSKMQNTEPDQIDSININEIIEKYGSYEGEFSQAMEYGSSTPEQIVVNLIVSDGDSERQYRDCLLKPSFKKIGVASVENDKYKNVTVIIYCNQYKNNDDSEDIETFNDNIPTAINSNNQPIVTLNQMITYDPNKEKEEEERKQKEKEKEERKQKEKEEEERKQKEKEEEERKQREKEEAERLKKEKEEEERKQREKEEAERLQKEKEEAEKLQKEK